MKSSYATCNEQETRAVAAKLAQTLASGAVLLLSGGLGAGKTAFVKGLLEGLGGDSDDVSSPSFTLMNVYEGGRLPLYHFDLYRLEGNVVLPEMDEYLFGDGVCAVEWPDRIGAAFEGVETVRVTLEYAQEADGRVITIWG